MLQESGADEGARPPSRMTSDKLDTLRRIETPEGVELTLTVAGPIPRILAWLVDASLRLGVLLLAFMILGLFGRIGSAAALLLMFFLEWLYPVAFELHKQGATPGKKLFGLRVVNDDGTPVRLGASMTRNLLRAVDFLPMMYGFGLLSMLCNAEFKRLGDLAAGTMVIYRDRPMTAQGIPSAPPLALHIALSVDEQRAVIDFARRYAELTPERAEEIAHSLEPLLPADEPGSASERVLRVANQLIGRA